MRFVLTLVTLCFSANVQCQFLEKLALSAEYRYLGRNVGGFGLEYRISDHKDPTFNVGSKVFYTSVERERKIVPQFNFEYGWIFMGGVSVTPYAVEPQIQLNLLNLIAINVGYAVPIHKQKIFKGFTFGLQMNIGVKGGQYYDYLKMGF